MSNEIWGFEGFQNLEEIIEKYVDKAENVLDVLSEGAKEFTNDLLKLPKPMSNIRRSGYTHLVRSFSYRKKGKEIELGWCKYYGPIVENGSKNMDARAHMYPLWDKNRSKYYKTMLTKLGF